MNKKKTGSELDGRHWKGTPEDPEPEEQGTEGIAQEERPRRTPLAKTAVARKGGEVVESIAGGVHPSLSKWVEAHPECERIKDTIGEMVVQLSEHPNHPPFSCLTMFGKTICLIQVQTFTDDGYCICACLDEDAEQVLSDLILSSVGPAKQMMQWWIKESKESSKKTERRAKWADKVLLEN